VISDVHEAAAGAASGGFGDIFSSCLGLLLQSVTADNVCAMLCE
jgi:hypothetical protein